MVQHPKDLELSILRHFSKLHSRLQITQDKLIAELKDKQNGSSSDLQLLNAELGKQQTDVASLIALCEHTTNSQDLMKSVNIKNINEMLKGKLKMPCFLVGSKDSTDNIR